MYAVQDRERSREKNHNQRWALYEKEFSYSKFQPSKKRKTVTFNDDAEVKIFLKTDEPSRRGLNMDELQSYHRQRENNSRQQQNKDSGFEGYSQKAEYKSLKSKLRQEKRKEQQLQRKIRQMKPEIEYYLPGKLKIETLEKSYRGADSIQKIEHQKRIQGVQFSMSVSDEPTFDIVNINSSTPLFIHFESSCSFTSSFLPEPPTKGILKNSSQVSQSLISLIQKMTQNPRFYNKQQVQTLLKPYKDNGQLHNLKNNQELYDSLTKVSPARTSADRSSQPRQPEPTHDQPSYIQHYYQQPPYQQPFYHYQPTVPYGSQGNQNYYYNYPWYNNYNVVPHGSNYGENSGWEKRRMKEQRRQRRNENWESRRENNWIRK